MSGTLHWLADEAHKGSTGIFQSFKSMCFSFCAYVGTGSISISQYRKRARSHVYPRSQARDLNPPTTRIKPAAHTPSSPPSQTAQIVPPP